MCVVILPNYLSACLSVIEVLLRSHTANLFVLDDIISCSSGPSAVIKPYHLQIASYITRLACVALLTSVFTFQ